MNISGTPLRVLLSHPPSVNPAMPSWDGASISARFADATCRTAHYDANLDFHRRYCLNPKRLSEWFTRIGCRKRAGDYLDSGAEVQRVLDSLDHHRDRWRKRMATAEGILHRLRSKGFCRPMESVDVCRHIRDLMNIVSLAHFPTRIQWGRVSFPLLSDDAAAEGLLEDPGQNPFLEYYRTHMVRHLGHADLEKIIVIATEPAQAVAAWTMARFVKQERPDVGITLFGPGLRVILDHGDADQVIAPGDEDALNTYFGGLGANRDSVDRRLPDFSGFPLSDYLTPERMLPLNDVPDGSAVSSVCEHLSRRYGATAFYGQSETLIQRCLNTEGGDRPSGVPAYGLSLPCHSTSEIPLDGLGRARDRGVRQIRWQIAGGMGGDFEALLQTASRKGIWNHVTLPDGTGADVSFGADKTTVHSLDINLVSTSPMAGSHRRWSKRIHGYQTVQPLPGRPYWQQLTGPTTLFAVLCHHPAKTIRRWRIAGDPTRIIHLGSEIQYHFRPPTELPAGYLDEICRMVESGGSVGKQWVRYNLERAFLIAYATEQGVIVANSSLKHPRGEYIDTLKARTGIDVSGYLERGYTSVRPEYRGLGIGTRLLDGLTRRAGDRKIFSIIDEDNRATQKIAIRNRTRRVATFYSEQLKKTVGIWMPEWMIDECESESSP